MSHQPFTRLALIGLLFIGAAATLSGQDGKAQLPPLTPLAWTLEEAEGHLALSPGDPYLQYVTLQLARQHGDDARILRQIETMSPRDARGGQRGQVDVFSLFTGALAVQESLQLETLRDRRNLVASQQLADPRSLAGPTIESHPWERMLAGKTPVISPLARMVPADQYLVQARSLTRLLELLDAGDLWGLHLFNQAAQDATSARVGERLREQLAVRTDPLSRPFYDLVVDQVAVTGSDLYLREGSDVTLIFQLKQPTVFQARMDQFLSEAAQHAGAIRSRGELLGVPYDHVATPGREVHVFSAYPRPDQHVRSNSKVALERVLAVITRRPAAAEAVEPLGETAEFRFIRTLMPEGAPEEDAFIYLSDAFIRRLVGPKLKLTERRRMVVYNHLRMIGHAALLFRTQFGRPPQSLAELVETRCAPGKFGEGDLANPFGGAYSFSADGLSGQCSLVGAPGELTPCCELPLENITQQEAQEYQAFVEQYNQYWRTFFDPIAIRVQMTPERYRAETIVLPLIDNSIYTSLDSLLGGRPEPLDSLPAPAGNIFSLALKLNKADLLSWGRDFQLNWGLRRQRDAGAHVEPPDAREFLALGLGNQIGLHLYDAQQMFDFNLPSFLGEAAGTFGGRNLINDEVLWISLLVATLNSPAYVSVPVADRQVVDGFLDQLDAFLAAEARRREGNGWLEVNTDYYQLDAAPTGPKVRAFALQLGPIKWRFFLARIGDGLYLASKKFILDDLAALDSQAPGTAPPARDNPVAHAMVRVRPQNWKLVLPDFDLGWAENHRLACLNNLGPLSGVSRGYVAQHPDAVKGDPLKVNAEIMRQAQRIYGVDFLALEGGRYLLAADGKTMTHSRYGSLVSPRQPARLEAESQTHRLLRDSGNLTAALTFLPDGLHAVLTWDKK